MPINAKPLASKIQFSQVQLADSSRRHIVVTLRESDNISTFVQERLDAWGMIQNALHLRLRPFDEMSLISHDGCVLHDRYVVLQIEGERIWFSKPARIVTRDPVMLFSDGVWEVVAMGSGYGLRNVRTGAEDTGITYASVAAAKNEVLKRQPRQVG